MIRRVKSPTAAALLIAACALATPSLAVAGSGGAALSTTSSSLSAAGTPAGSSNPLVRPGNVIVSASGAGITVSTTASALLRNQLQFTGTVPAADSGATVEVQRLGHETNWTWQPTAQGTVAPDGSFSAAWTTNHIGQFAIRAVIATSGAQAAAASPALSITVYRPSVATWYGPGFFGRRTACGMRLNRRSLGVANRSLACGTKVALYYQGRTLTVPVIDRGPYTSSADWDLTQATSRALGTGGTATIGAVSLREQTG